MPAKPKTPASPPTPPKPTAPEGLKGPGKVLWASIVDEFVLRPDELRTLADAARASDRLSALRAQLDGMDLMVLGSTGQLVVNPLVAEVRAHEAHVAMLLSRLKLKDSASSARGGSSRSVAARDRASERWQIPHGHSS